MGVMAVFRILHIVLILNLLFLPLTRSRRGNRQAVATKRIFQGWELSPHEFNFMVKLISEFPELPLSGSGPLVRTCGGALISPRWVLTARHCLTMHPAAPTLDVRRQLPRPVDAKRITAFLGSHGRYGNDGVLVACDFFVGRPDYGHPQCIRRSGHCGSDSTRMPAASSLRSLLWFMVTGKMSPDEDHQFTNDIALVRLSVGANALVHGQKIAVIPLARPNLGLEGKTAYVAGWGIRDHRDRYSATLKAAELVIRPASSTPACRAQNSWGKLCAVPTRSYWGGSVCPGDSGGPLVIWDDKESSWVLVGLLSNGGRYCTHSLPAVFTKVADYTEWIAHVVLSHDDFDNRGRVVPKR